MANPFLFEDTADYTEAPSSFNPFLCSGGEEEAEMPENPFLASVSTAPGTNPFADYSWDEPAGNNPGLLTPPAITNINDPENDFVVSSDDECSKPRRPLPPRPSIAKETHDLILSVTGALKATSDDLLERIPPTRAPSPTVFTDLSPSPVPDMFGGEPMLGLPQQPPRPPPPRPPVRPAPPSHPPAPAANVPAAQMEIDLFGTPMAPLPKSKDAILNLYSQPKPPTDLLSDDMDIPMQPTMPEPMIQVTTQVEAVDNKAASVVSQAEPKLQKEEPSIFGVSAPTENFQPEAITKTTTDSFGGEQPKVVLTMTPPEERAPQIFGVDPPDSQETEPVVEDMPLASPQKETAKVETSEMVHEQEAIPQECTMAEEPPETGGAGSPMHEPEVGKPTHQIFGVGAAAYQHEPQIFGVGPDASEPASNIFGMGSSAPETTPNIFGVGPPVPETTSNIFGVGPAVPESPPDIFGVGPAVPASTPNIFGVGPSVPEASPNIFGVGPTVPDTAANIFGVSAPVAAMSEPKPTEDAFDAFSAKFDEVAHNTTQNAFDAFGGGPVARTKQAADAWGSGVGAGSIDQPGFGGDSFDAFLSQNRPPPAPPRRINRTESGESEEGGFNVFIKPRDGESYSQPKAEGPAPALAPPPKSPAYPDPFDQNGQIPAFPAQDFQLPPLSQNEPYEGGFKRTDSQETPPTPLFDEDVSQPLEEFPRIHYMGDGWEMQLRHPNKKKITGQRFWKKIFVKLVYQGDNPVLQLFNLKEDKDPFQELPLQACYSISDISAQQYDQFGKIFTVKLQYIFYKERPGVRPGQVTKAERITTKLSQFAAYAIQGDYQGVKEFGSDLKKLGLPVEHAPQVSQLLKLGCMSFEDLKQMSVTIEECLFRMPVHRDRALTYKMEEVQITVVDEMYVEQDAYGHVDKQIARVRLFFLAFLSGMPDVELGVNDLWRQGKEVVGRHDIVPVVTEEWIRLEGVEFHSCIQLDEYEKTRTIKFKPPDACYIELMRFRIRPPRNRELPLQLKAVMCVTGSKVELRADVLVPGFTSRKLGQIPCEDVMIRFPIPECWIYLFRVEKHFRYGSVKSAHRRTGKIKGIERFLGAVDQLEASLMEVTSGQAKYEHQHRAIVWRMPRLPKEGQGAYTTHNLVCRMQLASYDQIPDNLADYAYVEFTMPATTASHTTVRSVTLVDSPSDDPPEKYVRQLARMEYRVGIEHTQGEEMNSYLSATATRPAAAAAPAPESAPSPRPPTDTDSDSSG